MVRLTDAGETTFDWLNEDVQTLRDTYERVRAKPIPSDAAWIRAGGVDLLCFPASHDRNTAIVYFHGGGFIVGSPVTHADIALRLCRHTGCPVYSVAYRLAPDHRAPAPAEDGIAVIDHLVSGGLTRVVICGDSAGGAIALATEASLPDHLRRHVVCVASFYGAHGLTDTASIRERGNRADGTDRDCVARYFDLAGGDAYSIATLATVSQVPAYIIAAEEDALRDDSLIIARALKELGRKVTIDRVENADHGFLHGDERNILAESAIGRFCLLLRLD